MYPLFLFLKIFYKTMKLESTSAIIPTLGGSHCHWAYSILFDRLEWAKCVKKIVITFLECIHNDKNYFLLLNCPRIHYT
jgi:hypothetical protein